MIDEILKKIPSLDMFTEPKVLVAMSGGVDSSLSAVLLKKRGFDVMGVTMHMWSMCVERAVKKKDRRCGSPSAIKDAIRVGIKEDIPHYVLNVKNDFEEKIVQRFIEEYLNGRTPNPCVFCNPLIKWKHLSEYGKKLGFPLLATGHYARIEICEGRPHLLKGIDSEKDQSYFLWGLTREDLSQTIFPVGGLTKPEVRKTAKELGIITAESEESQDLCFIAGNNYSEFLHRYIGENLSPGENLPLQMTGGEIVDSHGNILGSHIGVAFYTLGQRRGLGIAAPNPFYVISLDPVNNRLVVGGEEELKRSSIRANCLNYPSGEKKSGPFEGTVKIRYRSKGVPATIVPEGSDTLRVDFNEPQRAPTPGQSLVVYCEDEVIAGGIISTKCQDQF